MALTMAAGAGKKWRVSLRQRGHDVYTPTLTGLGERSHLCTPQVGLDLHIRDITQVLEYEDLREVMLTGHSYGGIGYYRGGGGVSAAPGPPHLS